MVKNQLLLLLLTTLSCNKIQENYLNPKVQILVKYQTLDEYISPRNSNCSNYVSEFLEMEEDECSFKIKNLEFDIEEKYILNADGNIKEYWTYKSEGPLTYKYRSIKVRPYFSLKA